MRAALKIVGGLGGSAALVVSIVLVAHAGADTPADKYAVRVPGGIAFGEARGYEKWQAVSLSRGDTAVALILANPAMIEAFRSGVPGNGKPFPDGAKMVKIHWSPAKQAQFPDTTVPGTLQNVHLMVKDAKRFSDSGGWGYGAFEYDAASDTFKPRTAADNPPQGNDAKCGFACHSIVKSKDFVFTNYARR